MRWMAALVVALAAIVAPAMSLPALASASLKIDVGAESHDQAIQVAYFLQRDVTVRQNTTVTWNFETGEIHSVNFYAGTGGGGPVDSGVLAKGAPPFSVTFPVQGTFNYKCDIHERMTGVVHVVGPNDRVPSQKEYDERTEFQKALYLGEGRLLQLRASDPGRNTVNAGIGVAHQYGSIFVMRFMRGFTTVRVGDTVTFKNLDPEAPHTVTTDNLSFGGPTPGIDPVGLVPPLTTLPGHAIVNSTGAQVNSGWLWKNPVFPLTPDQVRGTVFKMTFNKAGLYGYHCELHDELGMKGKILVLPKDH
jgi:plastocyanin